MSSIGVTDMLVLRTPALGVLHRSVVLSRAVLSRTLRLEGVLARFDGDLGRFTARSLVNGDSVLAVTLFAGSDSETTRVPLARPIVLPSLLPLRLAFGGELKRGKTYASVVYDPVRLAEQPVTVEVAAESTFVVADSALYDSTAMAWVPARFDTVLIRREPRATLSARYQLPARDSSLARWLAPAPLIQSEDPRIQAQARLIVGREQDPTRAARRIADWVRANLAQRPTATSPGALQALEARLGDCNEHAVLYVALARAAGLPARTAAGLVSVHGRFYYHAWAEVYLGDWVAVDPMLEEFPAGAAHVRFSIGGLAQQAELVRLIGRIKLEVL